MLRALNMAALPGVKLQQVQLALRTPGHCKKLTLIKQTSVLYCVPTLAYVQAEDSPSH